MADTGLLLSPSPAFLVWLNITVNRSFLKIIPHGARYDSWEEKCEPKPYRKFVFANQGKQVTFQEIKEERSKKYVAETGEAAISCGGVSSDMAACVSYLIGKAGDIPPPQCCAGRVIKLKDGAVTIADKHDVKATAAFISGIKDNAASSLPTKCKIQMEIPISKNFNCAE